MPTEATTLTDVYLYNGSLATLNTSLALSAFAPGSGEMCVADADSRCDLDRGETATFAGAPATYVGGGTATVRVDLTGLGVATTVRSSASVDVDAFQTADGTWFNYPHGNPASLLASLMSELAALTSLPPERFKGYLERNAVLEFDLDPGQAKPICLAADTLVDTEAGPVKAGALRLGDMVRTRDHGVQPVRWVGRRHLDALELLRAPRLRPIRIRAGALGAGTPAVDLVVSPQHRLLVRSDIARRMADHDEVLIAARHLVDLPGVAVARDLTSIVYVHIMFERHEIIWANGAETETFYPGEQALGAMRAAARAELTALFPEADRPGVLPARALVQGRAGRRLADRHIRNNRDLVA